MNQVAIRGLRYAQALIGRTYEFLCPAVSTPTLLRADFRRNWFFLLQKDFHLNRCSMLLPRRLRLFGQSTSY
jgi:hypothetical protein